MKTTHHDINAVPPLVEAGQSASLVTSGQALAAAMSPTNNASAVFLSPAPGALLDKRSRPSDDQPIYFVSTDSPPSPERREFLSDTLILFAAMQEKLKAVPLHDPAWSPSSELHRIMRKIAIDFVALTRDSWVHRSLPLHPDKILQDTADHYKSLYSCFSLFVQIYLPETGYEDAPVGEDLMEWLNIQYIEPSTEQGDQLSSQDSPWEDEEFWPYLKRTTIRGLVKSTIFFLNSLSQHPSKYLQELADALAPLIDGQPRLHAFHAEKDYAIAFRRWRDKIKAVRIQMDRVPTEERQDDAENWWDQLSDIVGVLEGRGEVLQRVCSELGADWKEVCVAWGIFIEPRLRRQDLPDIAADILEEMPPDPTDVEDMIIASLFSGQPDQTLQHASQLDRWLSAHLADMMAPLGLIDSGIEEDSDLTLRDEYILAYADYLQSDPHLWRLTVAYMYSCGEIGQGRGDEILCRVPLRLYEQKAKSLEGNPEDGLNGTLKQVNQTCFEYQRETVRRAVCKIAAQDFIRDKAYGLAVSYSASAEDWHGIGRIADKLLDDFISDGAESFAKHATDIGPSLADLQAQTSGYDIFINRLTFVVRYSRFHMAKLRGDLQDAASDLASFFHDDIAPSSWWLILLWDAVDFLQQDICLFSALDVNQFLRRIEEISTRTAQGAGEDYLTVFVRTIRDGNEKEALERLRVVRLALAKYLARWSVLSAGNS